MGLLDSTTQQQYYTGDDHGNYQFTSLDDIITQFQVAYVGEDKIISKIKRADIAFHAQRAMQELSFDTFKSIKSYQIELPPSLKMILPRDYVNYTKISWTDSSGIKHPLYPTKHTSNPFQIRQDDDGIYHFESGENLVINGEFNDHVFGQGTWSKVGPMKSGSWDGIVTYSGTKQRPDYIVDVIDNSSNESLTFKHLWTNQNGPLSRVYCVWQKINVDGVRFINLAATGESASQQTASTAGDVAGYGVVRVGISTTDPATGLKVDGSIGWARDDGTAIDASYTAPFSTNNPSPQYNTSIFDLDYVEWSDGSTGEKELEDVDVTAHKNVWVCVVSFVPFTATAVTAVSGIGTTSCTPTSATYTTYSVNTLDDINVTTADTPNTLQHANVNKDSDTWNNYKSTTPSENTNNDYKENTYWPNDGERYGLEPSHAQTNGSFFIDDRLGKIHFSSNISGKTIILDYISDSLGTDEEMKVHKFAEEAMYKSILCAIMSARANVGRNQLMYYKRDKFAAIRQAKLRLSNFKLEELTRILRGKSKHIKH